MVAKLVVGTLASFVASVAGWMIGAIVGGNYATEFTAFQARGYEATGIIGMLLAATLASSVAVWLIARRTDRSRPFSHALAGAVVGGVAAAAVIWIIPFQPWVVIVPALAAAIATEPRRHP